MRVGRPVHIGLSPNASWEDFFLAWKILLQPGTWKQGKAIAEIELWFKDYLNTKFAISFNAGRSALYTILKSLQLPLDSEIMLQAFTCVAVPNCVIWSQMKPVYVDIDATINFDVADAEKKVTGRTKAVIVQHTFGVPANMEKITAFCKKHALFLIEDCAHALGVTYQSKPLGSFGDAAIFSFGRDKVISSVFGGIAVTNNHELGKRIADFQNNLTYPGIFWIIQQLLHPVLTIPVLYMYNFFNIGKVVLYIFQRLRLLTFPVYEEEKQGKRPRDFPKKYPNALAKLLLRQLGRLEKFTKHRREVVRFYFESLDKHRFRLPKKVSGTTFLRFNVQSLRADELRFKAKQQQIHMGNWYCHIIDPKDVNLPMLGYTAGSCPNAEKIAQESLNLPTYPMLGHQQIQDIIALLNNFGVNYRRR